MNLAVVFAASFMGACASPPEPVAGMGYVGPDADPLVILPCLEEEVVPLDQMKPRPAGLGSALRYTLRLAPDTIIKAGESGGDPTEVYFPDPAIDAPLHGDWEGTPFVTYLRTCFAWGGFPGLREAQDPPREDLAFLTQGLLPL